MSEGTTEREVYLEKLLIAILRERDATSRESGIRVLRADLFDGPRSPILCFSYPDGHTVFWIEQKGGVV